jgi:hypothetical protein
MYGSAIRAVDLNVFETFAQIPVIFFVFPEPRPPGELTADSRFMV